MNFGDSLTKLAYMAKGQMGMQQTVDEEYDLKKKRFANYEQQQKEIKTHVQNLAKHFSAISSTLGFIAECSSKLYEENDQTYRSISKLTQIVNDIEQHQLPLFEQTIKKKVYDQMDAIGCNEVHKLMDQRELSLIKHDEKSDEVKKLVAKPPKDPAKLPLAKEAHKQAVQSYTYFNNATKVKLDEVLDHKEYFDAIMFELNEATTLYLDSMSDSLKVAASIFEDSKNSAIPKEKVNTMTLDKMKLNPDTIDSSSNSILSPDFSSTVIQHQEEKQEELQYEPLEQQFTQQPVQEISVIPAEYLKTEWYFVDAKAKQQGPYSFAQMKKLFKDGVIGQNTFVFGGDLSAWTKISNNLKLFGIFKMD